MKKLVLIFAAMLIGAASFAQVALDTKARPSYLRGDIEFTEGFLPPGVSIPSDIPYTLKIERQNNGGDPFVTVCEETGITNNSMSTYHVTGSWYFAGAANWRFTLSHGIYQSTITVTDYWVNGGVWPTLTLTIGQ